MKKLLRLWPVPFLLVSVGLLTQCRMQHAAVPRREQAALLAHQWRLQFECSPSSGLRVDRMIASTSPEQPLGYRIEMDPEDPGLVIAPCRPEVNPATDPDGDGWGLQKTSEMAAQHHALLALNGGFFDNETSSTPQKGEPVGLLRIAGKDLHPASGAGGLRDATLVFATDPSVHPRVDIVHSPQAQADPRYDMALEARQWLIDPSQEIPPDFLAGARDGRPGWPKPDARVAAGITAAGKLLLCVIAGDDTKDQGISLPDLRDRMREWGCVKAMNLDGGGSTTFILGGRTLIVSDNGAERPVSSALLIVPASRDGSKPPQ